MQELPPWNTLKGKRHDPHLFRQNKKQKFILEVGKTWNRPKASPPEQSYFNFHSRIKNIFIQLVLVQKMQHCVLHNVTLRTNSEKVKAFKKTTQWLKALQSLGMIHNSRTQRRTTWNETHHRTVSLIHSSFHLLLKKEKPCDILWFLTMEMSFHLPLLWTLFWM